MPIPPDAPVWIPTTKVPPIKPAKVWLPDPTVIAPTVKYGVWGVLVADAS